MKNLALVILAIMAINVSFASEELGERSGDAQKCTKTDQSGRESAKAVVVPVSEEDKKGSKAK